MLLPLRTTVGETYKHRAKDGKAGDRTWIFYLTLTALSGAAMNPASEGTSDSRKDYRYCLIGTGVSHSAKLKRAMRYF